MIDTRDPTCRQTIRQPEFSALGKSGKTMKMGNEPRTLELTELIAQIDAALLCEENAERSARCKELSKRISQIDPAKRYHFRRSDLASKGQQELRWLREIKIWAVNQSGTDIARRLPLWGERRKALKAISEDSYIGPDARTCAKDKIVNDPPLADIAEDTVLSARILADRTGVDYDTLRMRLTRLRKQDFGSFTEVENPKPNEARYLYKIGHVRLIIEDLKRT